MKYRLLYGLLGLALALNLALGAWIYFQRGRVSGHEDSLEQSVDLFAAVLQKVHAEYVDGSNLTYHALVYSALQGMVGRLDPHSEFLDAADYRELQNDTEGQFGGLGLVVEIRDGWVTVLAPIEDTPAFRAGILAGDRILKINGRSVGRTLPLDAVVKQLRGEPGTPVTLTIERPLTGAIRDFTLTRAVIRMDMVKDINGRTDFPLGPDGIGYVRITEFGDRTGEELESALDKLKAQGLKALILDLRGNPGGLLDEAVAVCQKFLPRGQLIVSTEGRDSVEKLYARGRCDELPGVPIVVLVNFNTASAAEIVTGCLQDLHRAIILGEKTFGKGSVQSIFPVDHGALKLTTAKYYTPSHRVIHEHGIMPDIFAPMSDAAEAALVLKREPGGLESLDPADRAFVESIQDTQLARAEDLLKAILRYRNLTQPQTEKLASP